MKFLRRAQPAEAVLVTELPECDVTMPWWFLRGLMDRTIIKDDSTAGGYIMDAMHVPVGHFIVWEAGRLSAFSAEAFSKVFEQMPERSR